MNVELINYTKDAVELLIYAKQTRKKQELEDVKDKPEYWKIEQLEKISETIPSSWEFVDYTFLITGVSRAFTHQFVRTRTGSYAQQSMRVTDQSEYKFVYPDLEYITDYNKWSEANTIIKEVNEYIMFSYKRLINEYDLKIEDARSILPTNIETNIVAKFNLRAFSDLVKSRLGNKRTQKEYKEVVKLMKEKVFDIHPWARYFVDDL